MNNNFELEKFQGGLMGATINLIADDAENDSAVAGINVIPAGMTGATVDGTTNGATDFVVLPSLSDVPVGHQIVIACNAGANFELRTPASSGQKINNVDSDGTAEYLCTDTDIVILTSAGKTAGWKGVSLTVLGAVRTAVVPDA